MVALPLKIRFCIDRLGTAEASSPGAWSEGWLAGTERISAAWLRYPGWLARAQRASAAWLRRPVRQYPLRLGFPRPDVAAAFPALPQGAQSGWHVILPPALTTPSQTLELVTRGCDGSYAAGTLRWLQGDVQQTRMTPIAPFAPEQSVQAQLESSLLESRLQAVLAERPGLTVRLDIVNKCNLRCVMCHFSDDRIFKRPARHITPEQLAGFFGSFAPAVREVVLSCGDEPLVSPHFEPMLRLLAAQYPHLRVVFNTNAMLLSERYTRAVVECGVTLVMVSIDGVTAQTFESIRRGARFERVLGNLVRLRRLRDAAGSARPLLVANFVLMRKNVHEAPLLVAVARELGLDYIDFRHVVAGAGYDASADTLETDPARFNYYRQLILASAKAQGVAVCIPPPLPSTTDFDPRSEPVATLQDLRRAVMRAPAVSGSVPSTPFPAPTRELDGTPAEVFHRLFCTRPFSEIMIRDQDEILPCPFYKQVLGRLSSGRSLREVFGGEAFRRLRQRMLLAEGDPGCADCPIKRGQLSQDMYGLE